MDAQAFLKFFSPAPSLPHPPKIVEATKFKKEMLTFLDQLSLQNYSLGITL